MRRLLALLGVLALVLVTWALAHADPPMCSITGTAFKSNGTACAACKINFATLSTQSVGGVIVPPTTFNVVTDGAGALPAGVQLAQGLRVNITVQTDTPIAVFVPAQSTVDISTLIASVPPGPPGFPLCLTLPSTTGQVPVWDDANNWWCPGAAGAVNAYDLVQDEGSDLTVRNTLNFIGSGVTCADDAGNTRTNCTIAAGGASTFDQLGSGTNTTAAMVVGTGSSLSPTGTGSITASKIALSPTPVPCPTGYFVQGIDDAGNPSCAALPAVTAISLYPTPSPCPAGQFATSISASGNPVCSALPAATTIALAPAPSVCPAGQFAAGIGSTGAASGCVAPPAATTLALFPTPSPCPAGQFASGINASGNPVCAVLPAATTIALAPAPSVCPAGQVAAGIGANGAAAGCAAPPAATTLALSPTPAPCPAGQFAQSINASGNPVCAVLPAATTIALLPLPSVCPTGQFAAGIGGNGAASGCAVPATVVDQTANYTWTGTHNFIGGHMLFPQDTGDTTEGAVSYDTTWKGVSVAAGVGSIVRYPPNLDQAHSILDYGPACDGVADDTAALAAAVNDTTIFGTYFQSIYIPSECLLNVTHGFTLTAQQVVCADSLSSGFRVSSRTCRGANAGRYPGAWCAIDADCPGGGAGACGGTPFNASSALFTYAYGGERIDNCHIDMSGFGPYPRCVGGTQDGRACRQTCSNNHARGCANDAGCVSGGTCMQGASGLEVDCGGTAGACEDCTAGGGTCTGDAGYPASGVSGVTSTNASGAGDAIQAIAATPPNGGGRVVNNTITNFRYAKPLVSASRTIVANNNIETGSTAGIGKGSNNVTVARVNYADRLIGAGNGAIVEKNSLVNHTASPTAGTIDISGTFASVHDNAITLPATNGYGVSVLGDGADVSHNSFSCGAAGILGIGVCAGQVRMIGNSLTSCETGVAPCLSSDAGARAVDPNVPCTASGVPYTFCTGSGTGTGFAGRAINVTFVGNRLSFGDLSKVVMGGVGWTVADNYLAWGTTTGPVVSIGYGGVRGEGIGHSAVIGNEIYSGTDTIGSVIGVADTATGAHGKGRCTESDASFGLSCTCVSYPCADNTHCTNTGSNNCDLAGYYMVNVANNLVLSGGASVGIDVPLNTASGSAIENLSLVGNQIIGNGTSIIGIQMPTVAANATNTTLGTTAFDNFTNGATNTKLRNWVPAMGRMDTDTLGFQKVVFGGVGYGVGTTTSNLFFPLNGAITATATEANMTFPTGSGYIVGMNCYSTTPPGATTKGRSFTLMQNGVAKALTCAIQNTAKTCSDMDPSHAVALNDSDDMDYRQLGSAAANCTAAGVPFACCTGAGAGATCAAPATTSSVGCSVLFWSTNYDR